MRIPHEHARQVRAKDAEPSPGAEKAGRPLIDRSRRAIDAMRQLRRASRRRVRAYTGEQDRGKTLSDRLQIEPRGPFRLDLTG